MHLSILLGRQNARHTLLILGGEGPQHECEGLRFVCHARRVASKEILTRNDGMQSVACFGAKIHTRRLIHESMGHLSGIASVLPVIVLEILLSGSSILLCFYRILVSFGTILGIGPGPRPG